MNYYYLLNNEQLMETFKKAKEEKLSEEFLQLLIAELEKRNLSLKISS